MENNMTNFIAQLSSKAPVPGGGGASALIGAVSSALCAMVANLTTGKKKYAAYQQDIERIITQTEAAAQALLTFIQKDAEAFAPLAEAYGLPKDTPNRADILEKALQAACDVPMALLRELNGLPPLLEELAEKGSKLAVSDVGVAATACQAALEGAVMNVYINTKLMKNREVAAQYNAEARQITGDGVARCAAVYSLVNKELQSPEPITETKALRGRPAARSLQANLAATIETLRAQNKTPKLAIIRVGARADDLSYERGILKTFGEAGAEAEACTLPEDCTQEQLEQLIEEKNNDIQVHGILLFRPLPAHLSEKRIQALIAAEKDVDCMGAASMAHLFMGTGAGYPPCTAQAVVEMLDHYGIDPAGKNITIVGRSLVVGKPLAMLLLARNATVTVCHTRTKDLPAQCRQADILVACAGVATMITKDYIAPGQTVIDVGINVKDGKLVGDVDFDDINGFVAAASVVPNGVGSITTSVLLKHTVHSAAGQAKA